MTAAEIIANLEGKFGPRIKDKQPSAIDPFVVVEPGDLLEVGRYLRDDLHFEILNCISGVDYLETDPKKVPKAGFEPHLEVVYHLSSFSVRGRATSISSTLEQRSWFCTRAPRRAPTRAVGSVWSSSGPNWRVVDE